MHRRRSRNPIGGYVRQRLHRRLFVWFGASILITGIVVAALMHLLSDQGAAPWRREVERLQTFIGGEFARLWDSPSERDRLAASMARELDLAVTILSAEKSQLATFGARRSQERCHGPAMIVPVARAGRPLGAVELCAERAGHAEGGLKLLVALAAAGLVLWGASGKIARRLARPLGDLARVTQEIGAGRLGARAELDCRTPDEFGVLAESINDMAGRIERQMQDQRVLLAAVSHELRTPLGHIRILIELARESAANPKILDDLEREVIELDSLVGELLASSRLDFSAINKKVLDAADVAKRALERAGAGGAALSIEVAGDGSTSFEGDPTLIARALANLIDNAKKHGGGLERLRVVRGDRVLAFEAEDTGPGFAEGDEARVFEPFYRETKAPGENGALGLGLALVKRIAEAHGGRAYASNRTEGRGARVGFELAAPPLTKPS